MAMTPTIHIGQEIEARINQLNITASEFARRIDTSKQNVNRILKKESIDTATLQKYCEALDFNFFTLFCPPPAEHFEAHGKHGIAAKSIGSVDNREIIEVTKSDEITEVGKISEEVILPQDCPEEARHAVEKLNLEVTMLKKLLNQMEKQLEEKERFINYLMEKK